MMSTDLTTLLLRIPALLVAVTFHEYAHARVAYAFGDMTAKMQGRLTLNPISHLDPIGTLMIFLVGFGWARPVPVNPYNFSDTRKGMLWVAFAGPLANFSLALIFQILYRFLMAGGTLISYPVLIPILQVMISLNILLGLFNLFPIPPLDGSKILSSLIPPSKLGFYHQIEPYAPIILILLLFTGILGRILFPLMQYMMILIDTIASFIIFW